MILHINDVLNFGFSYQHRNFENFKVPNIFYVKSLEKCDINIHK